MLAGVHRARHLAKHLPAAGWLPIVLCVDEAYHEERLDHQITSLVPSSLELVKVRALPTNISRPFGLGEISLRAWFPLRQALFTLLQNRSVDLVLITGSPYYPMLLASEIKRRFNVPVILDFQDPWVSAWSAKQSQWSKVGLSHRLATVLEPYAIRAANFITSVSENQNTELAGRYPWLDRDHLAAIPIGGDPDDYLVLREHPLQVSDISPTNGSINLSYVGTIWPGVIETVRAVLRSLVLLRNRTPTLYSKICLNFVGTDANPNGSSRYQVLPIAHEEGVADVVREIPRRLPYLQALSFLAKSDGILLLGSDEPHYTASKMFSAMMADRPFLSVFHRESSAHEILLRAGGGISLSFSSLPEEQAMLVPPLADALFELATSPGKIGRADPAAYASYSAEKIAERFAKIFDLLSS
jgi:hypothetical protein